MSNLVSCTQRDDYQWLTDNNRYPALTLSSDSTMVNALISGLANPGDTANIAIPLRAALTDISTVSFYDPITGWIEMSPENRNDARSIGSTQGICPSPSEFYYRSGLKSGDFCLMLSIVDGGSYDSDNEQNGEVSLLVVINRGSLFHQANITVNHNSINNINNSHNTLAATDGTDNSEDTTLDRAQPSSGGSFCFWLALFIAALYRSTSKGRGKKRISTIYHNKKLALLPCFFVKPTVT